MANPEDNFGDSIERGIRERWTYVREMEHLSREFAVEGNKRCVEALAWFAGAAASLSLVVYGGMEKHQLEQFPPDKTAIVGGLLGLALAGGGGKKFIKGVSLSNHGTRLHGSAEATKRTIAELERFVD